MTTTNEAAQSKLRIHIQGAVQGVGFRPFVYRLAHEMNLSGWVSNSSQGVIIEVEGSAPRLDRFLERIQTEKPHHSVIQTIKTSVAEPEGFTHFSIQHSDDAGEKTTLLLPDIATCKECLHDIFDSSNRRYLYPFTNCTHCGPRFTIIHDLPYDRCNTSMKTFTMCPECQAEYDDPLDRRFHAQPNACPVCGPKLEYWDETGKVMTSHHEALLLTAEKIRAGEIVAVKGIGGFHLLVDGRNEPAVQRLRERKHRYEKPLALMFPNVEMIRAYCQVSELEDQLLHSPEAPIVLLQSKESIALSIAPGNPYLGCMLPYTPLHHILMRELNFPVVATSGNLSEEPICFEEHEACQRLWGIADGFLVHNRPILRHADDSVVRVIADELCITRRARGFAPMPIHCDFAMPPMLAVGGHLKNTVTFSLGNNLFTSQHIGDLETRQSYDAFTEVIASFERMYASKPEHIVCDLHPDYLSTQYAVQSGLPVIQVQHHFAHVLSCMVENQLEGPVLGISWDGTGFGSDGTIWGSEFLQTSDGGFQRVAHLRYFPLPSGEKSLKEPRRVALGLLYEAYGEAIFQNEEIAPVQSFSENELSIYLSMLQKKIHSPPVCSIGRLFDAVTSITEIRQTASFEGQGAMELEFAIGNCKTDEFYPYEITPQDETLGWIIDWKGMVDAILSDKEKSQPLALISARFHNALVEVMVAIAKRVELEKICLTGGCFQNRYLTERAIERLQNEGFQVYRHRLIPPNDGGISLGQIIAAYHRSKTSCV